MRQQICSNLFDQGQERQFLKVTEPENSNLA